MATGEAWPNARHGHVAGDSRTNAANTYTNVFFAYGK
jgi:hypothetical protein